MVEEIIDWLISKNIDPFYFFTVISILLVISYRKELQNWDKIFGWQKDLIRLAIAGAIVFSFTSLLKLTGIIELNVLE